MIANGSTTWSLAKTPVLLLVAVLAAAGAADPAGAQIVKVTASSNAGGRISPSGALTLPVGSSQTFAIAADTGFFLERIVVDGKALPPAPEHTFENLDRNHKIVARFKRHVHTLTIAGEEGVKVTPSGNRRVPYGKPVTIKIKAIAAGATPSATVDDAPVPLTPTKAGWSLVVTVTGDHVVAVLDGLHGGVQVDKTGEGSGTVASEPPAIDCGDVCTAGVTPGTALRLTATPGEGSVFVEWSGACAGSDPACDVTVNGATSVGARFDLAPAKFAAAPSAEPGIGKRPLAVRLVPGVVGAGAPVAFYAWDWDGDGMWDSCDPDDPGNPSLPCDTGEVPQDVLYESLGTFYPTLLVQTAGGERAIASAVVHVHGTTSEQKILAALAAGTIDEETALIYRIYAGYGDPRLPPDYTGDDPAASGGAAARELADRFDTLSAHAQALLGPFLMPPIYEGSWYDLRQGGPVSARALPLATTPRPACSAIGTGWRSIPLPGVTSKVRVWWDHARKPQHELIANDVLTEVNNVIWPSLQRLLGREPLKDDVLLSLGCDGGDGLLDIYLVPSQSDPVTAPAARGRPTPAYIILSRLGSRLKGDLAHELFHAFSFAYDVPSRDLYKWIQESSADWAIDHVYGFGDHGEQPSAPAYLHDTKETLGKETSYHREYGSYVFLQYLARNYAPAWIAQIWAQMESAGQVPFDAIDAVIGGGLEKRWPEFARRAWNRQAFDHFLRWDGLAVGAKPERPTVDIGLTGSQPSETAMPVSLPPLSIQYYHYRFPDPSARSVTFYNGLTWNLAKGPLPLGLHIYGEGFSASPIDPVDRKGAKVQALMKVGGVWKAPQDWTEAPYVSLCRDTIAERIEELVLIFSNSDKTPNRTLEPFDRAPTLRATNIACHQWSGEATFRLTEDGVTTRWHLRELKFARMAPVVVPALGTAAAASAAAEAAAAGDPAFNFATPYRLVAGKLDLSVHGTDSNSCSHVYDLTGLLMSDPRPAAPTYLNVLDGVTFGVGYRDFQLNIARFPAMSYSVSVCCPGTACTQRARLLGPLLFHEPLIGSGLRLTQAGDRMEGDGRDVPGGATAATWHLDAIRE